MEDFKQMEYMGLNQIREKYLSFFESKEHLRLPSFPLIPQNDKSLLLINSGMAPMKKFFTGEIMPPRKRVTTCQKCIRTPDIERVGKTARHGTYFEMLGNFSFGDYFKHEATKWAWEFITETLQMPIDKIWVSIYEEDDQAFDIWVNEVGVSPERIVRLGKADNFWEHGSGPCGPCSELYFDRGEKYGCGSHDCAVGCDCDRYVEFWNLVFTQFNSDGNGNYVPLAKPNIDTGMGLERLACIMQGVGNLFEVDTVQKIMKHISRLAGISYGDDAKKDVSLRVVTDHIRSTTFMVGDGVMPSNVGRGYVLRRLLRRAARHGRLLGIKGSFLTDVCDTVIQENKEAYPELSQKSEFIKKMISIEEENFSKTIDQGLILLNNMIENLKNPMLIGTDAFKLYDTFGFPIDLTKEILEERSIELDEEGFQAAMLQQKTMAKSARKSADTDAWKASKSILDDLPATEFAGYTDLSKQSKIIAILMDDETVQAAGTGDEVIIILDSTPFYAESGGQVGDAGELTAPSTVIKVNNTTKTSANVTIHTCIIESGGISVGDTVSATVDTARRNKIMRNHTAAHLTQAALRNILGNHVHQAGQLVDSERMRFDFNHFQGLTPDEITKIENQVNETILSGIEVVTTVMSTEEAKKNGAMALFSEKYGDTVRVVKVGTYSMELCGGTHINNTAKIGLFKIVSESSVAAGVRRIEAVTGTGVLELLSEQNSQIAQTAETMKVNHTDIIRRAVQLMAEIKAKDKEIERLNNKIASSQLEDLMKTAKEIKGIKVIVSSLSGINTEEIRVLGEKLKDTEKLSVSVFALINEDKLNFAAFCGTEAVKKGAQAGNILKEVAKIAGGGGGGRPETAMAGGKDISKADEALSIVYDLIEKMIK